MNRFHYDAVFGTVLNRFCVEAALGRPLSVYGLGGQTRSFINLRDTTRCIALAVEHAAQPGEFRVFNQFTEIFSVLELAHRVQRVAGRYGPTPEIEHICNPRVEHETHYYGSTNNGLLSLGLKPHLLDDDVLEELVATARRFRDRIDQTCIDPTVAWGADRCGAEDESSDAGGYDVSAQRAVESSVREPSCASSACGVGVAAR